MKNITIELCIIGTIIVGLYVAEIYYKNYWFTQLNAPVAELTVEQFQEIPHKVLADFAENSQGFILSQKKLADTQQQNLRRAILLLSAWLLIMFYIVLSQVKALNKCAVADSLTAARKA